MAHELKSDRIKVNQTLHGYSDGHRLIEGSIKLSQPDARTMLVLSDASGSGSRIPSEGYLTGYPLAESGRYVLARTWAAPEMSRPGCVWTHSLLIDFADLARLASADELLERFSRPPGGSQLGYGAPIDIEALRSPTPVARLELHRAAQWVSALYGKPKAQITAEREGSQDDGLTVAIWMQQWPRLRRTFRFCSCAAEDRSTSADKFDLQLMSAMRASRIRIPDGISASSVAGADWVEPLLYDLEAPSRYGLRRFLRDVGADITNGRAAMAPLTQLFTAVAPSAGPERITEAVSELERLGTGQGRMGRAAAARAVLSRTDIADPRLFEFALDQVRSDSDLLGIDAALVGDAVLRWRPDLLVSQFHVADPLQGAISAALLRADAEPLVDILARVPDTLNTILSVRPDILELPSLWRIPAINAPRALGLMDLDEGQATAIVTAMIEAGREDCSSMVVDRFGARPVIRALSASGSWDLRPMWPWLRSVARRTEELADCMSSGVLVHRPLLYALAAILDPDAIPNAVGCDPWVTAVEATSASGDVDGEDILAAFLFNRARGWRSKSPGRLFFLSVQRLHEAMASGRISDGAWRIVNQRLPGGSIWREWGRCEKLRHAVVDRFVDSELPPVEFGTVVDDGNLWWELVVLAADSSRGRRYLDRVRGALRDGGQAWWNERAKVIDRKIK